MKRRFNIDYHRHWFISKYRPGAVTDTLIVPLGMTWYAIPPGKNILDKGVLWFPSGRYAINYFVQLGRENRRRASLGLKPIGAKQ